MAYRARTYTCAVRCEIWAQSTTTELPWSLSTLVHVAQLVERSVWSVVCCGFESHLRQLIFLRKSACFGCAVLLWPCCLYDLVCFFLHSHLSLKHDM